MDKKKKSILKTIVELLLGFTVLSILPAVVFGIALFSIPLAFGVITLITFIEYSTIVTKIDEIKQSIRTKEFLQMFNMKNN